MVDLGSTAERPGSDEFSFGPAERIDLLRFVIYHQAEPVVDLTVIGCHFVIVYSIVIRSDHHVVSLLREVLIIGRDFAPVNRFVRRLSNRCHGSAVARHEEGVAALFELLEQGILNIILRIDEGGVNITLCA